MNQEVISIRRSGGSTRQPLVPRAHLDTTPFDAQERDEIVVRYFYLGQSIQVIAEVFAQRGKYVGQKCYQNVLRFGFFRAVGNRRKDIADRGTVAA